MLKVHPHFAERFREERRRDRAAAVAFENACRSGDGELLRLAAWLLNEEVDGWRLAIRRAARLGRVEPEIQDGFVAVWTEHKGLALRTGERRAMARALGVLLPRPVLDAPVRPHSWLLLLETLAAPDAVLYVRDNQPGYYEESEYIVDPYKLTRVQVVARLPSTGTAVALHVEGR